MGVCPGGQVGGKLAKGAIEPATVEPDTWAELRTLLAINSLLANNKDIRCRCRHVLLVVRGVSAQSLTEFCPCIFQLPCISLYSSSSSSRKMKRQFLGHFHIVFIAIIVCLCVCLCALHCSLCARTLCIFHLCCFPLSISPFLSLCSRIELSSTYAELTKLLLSAASFIADQLTVFYISQYRLYDTNFLYEHCEMKAKWNLNFPI